MKLGLKNFLMITLIAILGIAMFKVIFNKVQVPGVSNLVNAV
jgi:hypothetical protein